MVFGPKFPWARARQLLTYEKRKARVASFTDEEAHTSPIAERILVIPDLDNPPTSNERSKPAPVQPSVARPGPRAPESPASQPRPEGSRDAHSAQADLKLPGPVRAIAICEALDRFEEVAQSTDGTWKYDSQGPSSRTVAFDTHISYLPAPQIDEPHAEGSESDLQRRSSEDVAHSTDVNTGAIRRGFKRQHLRFEDLSPASRRLARIRAAGNICFHPPSPSPTEVLSTSPDTSDGLACRDGVVTTPRSTDSSENSASENDHSSGGDRTAVQRYWEGPIVFTVDDDCDFSDEDEEGNVCTIFPDPADVQEDNFSDDSFYDTDTETRYSGDDGDDEEVISPWARTLEN